MRHSVALLTVGQDSEGPPVVRKAVWRLGLPEALEEQE